MKIVINVLTGLILSFYCPIISASSGDFIDKTVTQLLKEKIVDERVILEPEYNSKKAIEKIKAQQGKIENITLEHLDTKYSSFRVQINYSDGTTETISGRYVPYVMIPVAARYIKFGEIIQQSDLTTKKIRLDKITKNYLTELEEVVGMQTKKYIPVGKMFKNNEISSPKVIKNGDPVNIVYDSGIINLKTVGTAMDTGAVGDMIKVKNSSSGAVLLGQIINKNTVKIGGDNE